MIKMKLIIAIIIAGCMTLQVNAQPVHKKGVPAEMAKKQGDEWQKKLSLTDNEKAKFVEAKTAQLTKLQGLERNKGNREVMQSSAIDFENSLKAAFSPEHFDAWKKAREDMKKNRQDKKGRKGGKDGLPNNKEEIN
jgi:hypothetical protein